MTAKITSMVKSKIHEDNTTVFSQLISKSGKFHAQKFLSFSDQILKVYSFTAFLVL